MNPIYSFKITSKNASGQEVTSPPHKVEYNALNDTLTRLAKERISKGHTHITISIKHDPEIKLKGFAKKGKVWKINYAAEEYKVSEKISKHTSSKKGPLRFFKKKNLELKPPIKATISIGEIDRIPYEIWESIFNFAGKEGSLNFASIAFSFRKNYFPFLFENFVKKHVFDSFDNPIFSSKEERIKITESKKFVKRFSWNSNIKADELSKLAPNFLHIEGVYVDVDDLKKRMKIYHNLTTLHLLRAELSFKVFNQILENCPNLKKLKFLDYSEYMALNDNDLHSITVNCPDLKNLSLDLKNKTKLPIISKEFFVKFINDNNKLKKICLTNCYSFEQQIYIAKKTKKLTNIDFSQNNSLTDKEFIELIPNYPHLKKLDLTGCRDMTSEALKALTKPLPFLKEITLNFQVNFIENSIIELVKKAPNLKRFFLKTPHLTTDQDLELSDEFLKTLSQNCPHIQIIYLNRVNFTDKGIIAIAERCREIEKIRFKGGEVTDKGLEALSTCPNLKKVNIYYCNEITIKGIECLASAPKMRKIGFYKNYTTYSGSYLESKFPKVKFNIV